MQALGVSANAFRKAAQRLARSRRLVRVRGDFHVIVPLDYYRAGITPPEWFIDDLMRHLGVRYYLGALTAAAYHGATHQRAMRMGPGAPSASRKRSASSSSPLASSHLAAMSSRKASCKSSR